MRTLQAGINAEDRFDLLFAAATATHQLPPVYVTSHRRADKLDTLRNIPYLQEHATLVVAEQELETYREHWPDAAYLVIPQDYGTVPMGHGRALQFTLEQAHAQGEELICILDDDLKAITALYSLEDGDRVSRARQPHVGTRMGDFFLGCLVTMGLIAREAFTMVPSAVVAGPQVNNADRRLHAAMKRWALNQGGNPAQFQFIHVPRLMALTGGWDVNEFAQHGDDISLAVDILAAGGSIVDIPTFVTDWRDYELESTMRTPETAPMLRQMEHQSLMQKPLAQYVRTRYDMLDRPQWHSVHWVALKNAKLAPSQVVLWEAPSTVVVEAQDYSDVLAELI